jgi:hypothetical protein
MSGGAYSGGLDLKKHLDRAFENGRQSVLAEQQGTVQVPRDLALRLLEYASMATMQSPHRYGPAGRASAGDDVAAMDALPWAEQPETTEPMGSGDQ